MYHIIGKDIIKFHGIYWLYMLNALELNPFKKIIVHDHWMKDN